MCVCQSRHSGDLLHRLPLKVKISSASIKSYTYIDCCGGKRFYFFLMDLSLLYVTSHFHLARPCVGFVDGQLEKFLTKFAFGEPQQGS